MNDIVYMGLEPPSPAKRAQAQNAWDLIYFTSGSGKVRCRQGALNCQRGSVAVVPPPGAFRVDGDRDFRCIHLSMLLPALGFKEPTVIQDENGPFLRQAFEAALHHFQSGGAGSVSLLSAYGSLISGYLALSQMARRRSHVVESIEQNILNRCADPGYALDDFLRALPFNYDYLRKLFQKEMGVTPHQYLNSTRLQMAAEALMNAEISGAAISMTDIARQCGFREPLYFSRMFKKRYGLSPSFYAKAKCGKLSPGREDEESP